MGLPVGAYPLPSCASAGDGERLGELLAAGLDAASLTVPWAACQARFWRDRDRTRRIVAVVHDIPGNAADATVEGRLAALGAQAVVACGVNADNLAQDRHKRAVQAAADVLQDVFSEPEHPLALAGLAAAQLHLLATYCDTVLELERLVEAVVATALASGELPVPEDRWQAAAWRALAEALEAKIAQVAAAARPDAIAALLQAVVEAAEPQPALHKPLQKAGLLYSRADGAQPGKLAWSRLVQALGAGATRQVLQRENPDWPWRILPPLPVTKDHSGRDALLSWTLAVAWHGLVPAVEPEILSDGLGALHHLVEGGCGGSDQLRAAVRPWLELVERLAMAPPQPEDYGLLQESPNAALAMPGLTQDAGFRFGCAALFDVLAVLQAMHAGDQAEIQRRWPGLAWTLDRLGGAAVATAAWLRIRLALAVLGDEIHAPFWDSELAQLMQPGRLNSSAPSAAKMRGWLALSRGDVAGAQAWWTQASQRAQRTGRLRLALRWAVDVAQLLLLIGESESAVKLAKLATERLGADHDFEFARWAGVVWLLAALGQPEGSPTHVSVAEVFDVWAAQVPQVAHHRALAEGIDPSALLRCGALLIDERATEVQPMLQYFVQEARSREWRGLEAAALAAQGWCAWWLGDADQACSRWKDAARLPQGPASSLLAGHLWVDVARLQQRVGSDRSVAAAVTKALELLEPAAALRLSFLQQATEWSELPGAGSALRKVLARLAEASAAAKSAAP